MPDVLNAILEFFKEFGSVVNAALILSLAGLLTRVLRATIAQKDAHIAVLDRQLKLAEMFSAKNAKEEFEALQEWYTKSVQKLEEEKRKAIESSQEAFREQIEDEIAQRREIMERYGRDRETAAELPRDISRSEIIGSYRIVGHNPHMPQFSYFGELSIQEDGEVLAGEWSVGPLGQRHEGVGLAIGNAVAFEFAYSNRLGQRETGVVLYRFIGPGIMRGYWTGLGIDKVGFEECRKVQSEG